MRPTTIRLRCAWCQRVVEVESSVRRFRWKSAFEDAEPEYVCVMCRSQFNLPAVREEFRVITPPAPLPATPPPPRPEPPARSWWKRLLRIG